MISSYLLVSLIAIRLSVQSLELADLQLLGPHGGEQVVLEVLAVLVPRGWRHAGPGDVLLFPGLSSSDS